MRDSHQRQMYTPNIGARDRGVANDVHVRNFTPQERVILPARFAAAQRSQQIAERNVRRRSVAQRNAIARRQFYFPFGSLFGR